MDLTVENTKGGLKRRDTTHHAASLSACRVLLYLEAACVPKLRTA